MAVILALINIFIEKHKNPEKKEDEWAKKDGSDEDATVIDTSEDDQVESLEEKNLVTILSTYINNLPELLSKAPAYMLAGAMQEEEFVPLGQYRLMLTKLVILVLRLKRDELNELLLQNDIFKALSGLIAKHPWNNFFQLAIIKIYKEVVENGAGTAEFRQRALKNSNLIETITGLKDEYNFTFGSERQTRNGYMGMIIQISSFLVSQKAN